VVAACQRLGDLSPSRWLQVIPAACRNVGISSSRAQSASQVARSYLMAVHPDPGGASKSQDTLSTWPVRSATPAPLWRLLSWR
jgi:hypothetical protein